MPNYTQDILECIARENSHPTADEIFGSLKAAGSKISQATVYNNLNSLCAQGKIQRIACSGSADCYDMPTKHDHVVCPQCGQLVDIHLKDLTAALQKELGKAIEGYDLRVYRTCENCAEQVGS